MGKKTKVVIDNNECEVGGNADYIISGDRHLLELASFQIVFLFLSIKFDPFVTTAYMRHGKFNGMKKRGWTIFMGSLLISNVYWTLALREFRWLSGDGRWWRDDNEWVAIHF